MSKIILFTLGSVQDYIMESRKVIDLVNSSKMISNLMKSIKDEFQLEIVLPYCNDIEKDEDTPNFPNYLIAQYESNDSKGKRLEDWVRKQIRKEAESDELSNDMKEQVQKHIASILDIYWIEAEVEEDILRDDEQYKKLYKEMYNSLEAIKHVKKFEWVPEAGRKCSICGKRNALFYRNDKKKKNPPFDIQKNAKEIKAETLKAGECLCGACYIKRTFSKNSNVKSTAQIALDNWMDVTEKNSHEEYNELQRIIGRYSKNSDYGEGQLLYKDVMMNEIDKQSINNNNNSNQFKNDKARIEALFKVFEGNKVKQETYYCIYRADIDDLGKWMSGEYKINDEIKLLKYQKTLSERIYEFLARVKDFCNRNKNTVLVYAGGDDILALMPIRTGIELTKKIHEYFNETVKEDRLFEKMTFSHGLFITHYKDTLKESLMISKERMESIKEKYKSISRNGEKNGFMISVLTEGYFYKEFHAKNIVNQEYTINLIEEFRKYFNTESTYFHDTLSSMFLEMDKGFGDLGEQRDVMDMLLVTQQRLMERSRKDKEKKVDERIKNLLSVLLIENNYEYDSVGIENYFNMFYIIQKISNILGDDIK